MQKRSFTAGGFSPDRGKKEEIACAIRANPAEPGRWGGRTERQDRAAGRGGKTKRQDGAAEQGGRTGRQDGAARRSGKTERQKKRGRAKPGHRSGQVRGRRPHKQKTGETHNVPPVLAPGFQPPGAAGQRKSARRSSPASAKGQRTGSQYAVRTPGRVQYYPHGRR